MIKIGQTAKLPLDLCRGNTLKRSQLAHRLNRNFFNKINKDFNTKDISPEIFEKRLCEITKNKIECTIADSSEQNYKGACRIFLNEDNQNEIAGFSLCIPLNKYDKKVALYDADIFMHESFHFFYEITNPKNLKRNLKAIENNLILKTEEFYKKYLYSKEKFDKKTLEKNILPNFLKTLSKPERIDFLQNSRYRLSEEMQAFKDGAKYYDKIQDNHLDLISEKIKTENGESYNFKKKINLLNRTLAKELQAQRNELKNIFMLK